MLRQILAGHTILVADDDYMNAHETCQYLHDAGARTCGPVPSNEEALRRLRSDDELDGIVLKTQLRDGPARPTLLEVQRRGLPVFLAEAGRNALGDVPDGALVLQLPLIGPRPARLIGEAFAAAAARATGHLPLVSAGLAGSDGTPAT